MLHNRPLPPIAIKPLPGPEAILYGKHWPALKGIMTIRSLSLITDFEMICHWVNRNYAHRYWRLNGDRQRVWDTYYNIQRNSHAHSFIGLLNETPICQFDIYRVMADEISVFINPAAPEDCGFHLLMAPNKQPLHGLTTAVIQTMLSYYFSFAAARRMYAEPDITNARSNRLLLNAGFIKLQTIRMSYKTAHLYVLTRERFEQHAPILSSNHTTCYQ